VGHTGWVNCLISNEEFLFSGVDDHKIIIWNIKSGQMLETLNGHVDSISSIIISDYDGDMYTGSYDQFII